MNGDTRAAVVTSPPPTTAPHKERYFDRVDENNPEYLRERNMAPDLRQDFNMMEQKKRVSMILQSPAFCEELESMIQEQFKKGKNPTGLLALQQIADFMTTNVPSVYPAAPQGGMAALNMTRRLGLCWPPWRLCRRPVPGRVGPRRKRLEMAGSSGGGGEPCGPVGRRRPSEPPLTRGSPQARVSPEQEHFLIVPFGLLYSEVTASSLVKVNLQGDVVDRGSTNLGVNQAGFTLHSAIYAARPDAKCVVHIHTPAGAAVSAMRCGLLPISPEALSLGEVTYHDYRGILVDEEEKVLIQKNLGPKSKALILRNHGLVSVGESVEEAFFYIHSLVVACEIQGYRTGYPYRYPALREKAKKCGDTEAPAGAAGCPLAGDGDPAGSPLRHSFQKQQRDKTRWLNSGRGDGASEEGRGGSSPKAKTKWAKEDGHRTSASAVPNLFVPLNTNPKEVQEMRNKGSPGSSGHSGWRSGQRGTPGGSRRILPGPSAESPAGAGEQEEESPPERAAAPHTPPSTPVKAEEGELRAGWGHCPAGGRRCAGDVCPCSGRRLSRPGVPVTGGREGDRPAPVTSALPRRPLAVPLWGGPWVSGRGGTAGRRAHRAG
ncbi:PREDICTED: alpha-adducin [Condylura cristata]|uniref:alpha-adducin n=1 Tax=Condylura cristata TaxID=143302 RepID=UPI000642CAB6|nr:PREDICTED: alpha-adducin [Condylura cristata]